MLDHVCYIALDSPNQTEFIYAQVVRDELGYGGSVKKFVPSPTNSLMDFMRGEPEKMFIVIGSAELAMGKFLVFYKCMEAFQVVSKEGVKALLHFETKHLSSEKSASLPLTGKARVLGVSNSVYKGRRISLPRPNTPEAPDGVLEGTSPTDPSNTGIFTLKIENSDVGKVKPPSRK